MPIITTAREDTCRACGGRVRKGELADYESAKGVAHLEPECRTGEVRFRPNRRAGTCRCGARVPKGGGLLLLERDEGATGGGKRWAVRCARCSR